MSGAVKVRSMIYGALCQQRRLHGSTSPETFAEAYLPHHFELPPSPMHDAIFEVLAQASDQRGRRIAIAAPRGHAKSTCVTLAYALYAVLCRQERYILIASATKEQASQLLKHAKDELETNRRLREDFPEAYRGARTPWRGTKITVNGTLIQAVGAGQQIRGIKNRQHRPSLVIVDDLETQDHVQSEEQRHKTREWFEKTLLKIGDDRTNVIVVGTILHYDALLAKLIDQKRSPGWHGMKYKALLSEPALTELWTRWEEIFTDRERWQDRSGPDAAHEFYESNKAEMDEGGSVLWPQREPLETLLAIRLSEGRASFDSEKQNEPLDPEQCLFRVESMDYWDDEHGSEEHLLRHLGGVAFYGAWDPSLGKNPNRGDYSAIVIVAHHSQSGTCYVLAADIERRAPIDAIKRIIRYAGMYKLTRFLVEANGFQEELCNTLNREASAQSVRIHVEPIKNSGSKAGRIELLEPAVSQGKVRFCRKHTRLLEQLRQFPLGAHDDGPDALEMAVRAAQRPRPRITIM